MSEIKEESLVKQTSERGAFKVKEACEYLGGISKPTVYRLVARGLIKPHPALRHLVFSREELDRFLRN